MKFKYVSVVVSFVAAVFLSVGALNAAPTDDQNKKDGEILELLIVANNNEIAAAKVASKKATTPAVKAYAEMLKTQHEQNLAQTEAISKSTGIKPVNTTLSKSMTKDGKKELKGLKAMNAKDIDKAYILAMVKGHMMVIELFDTNLMKNVTNESIKNHLAATYPHLQDHLKQAQEIAKTQN